MEKKEVIIAGLKGVADQIPVLGGLVTAYSEYDNSVKLKNIGLFLEDLKTQSISLSQKMDDDFVKTDEAVSLTRRTIDLAQKEHKAEKRTMYARFLANAFTTTFSSKSEKEAILNTIELLSPVQFACLIAIKNTLPTDNVELGVNYNPDATDKPEFKYITESILVKHLLKISPGLTDREAEALLSSMASIGVIETHSTRGWTRVGGKEGIIGYRPTKLGLVVCEYLIEQKGDSEVHQKV